MASAEAITFWKTRTRKYAHGRIVGDVNQMNFKELIKIGLTAMGAAPFGRNFF